ncbi:MAG TPA: heme o synthase [Stellaceae bacterium]|nr:heme o synthase [Stellaceae bacterium]
MSPLALDIATVALQRTTPADFVPAVGDYFALLKPRVMSLVVFTGFVGLYLAPGHLHPLLAAVAVLCIAVGAGAAGAINMWYERDIDALMERTRHRPLPAGRMAPGDALGFGAVLAVSSVIVMGLALNPVAAVLLALAIGFYVFVYTIGLKRRTPQNIVIGGAAGAFPPMIGWAAVTGQVGVASLALFALIFFWTPPHFWALSLYRAGDYARAGVPMLPVVAGKTETKKQMLLYTLVLWPVAVAPALLHATGWLYGAAALVLSALFTLCAVSVWRDTSDRAARRMFGFSLLYLFLLFALMAIDRAPGLFAGLGLGA